MNLGELTKRHSRNEFAPSGIASRFGVEAALRRLGDSSAATPRRDARAANRERVEEPAKTTNICRRRLNESQ